MRFRSRCQHRLHLPRERSFAFAHRTALRRSLEVGRDMRFFRACRQEPAGWCKSPCWAAHTAISRDLTLSAILSVVPATTPEMKNEKRRYGTCSMGTTKVCEMTTATSVDCRQQNSHYAMTCTQVAPCTLGLQEEMAVVLTFCGKPIEAE